MHTNFLLVPLLSLSTCVAPALSKRDFIPPEPYIDSEDVSASTNLQKRNVGGVRLSDGKDFSGHVWYGVVPLAECIALNS